MYLKALPIPGKRFLFGNSPYAVYLELTPRRMSESVGRCVTSVGKKNRPGETNKQESLAGAR